MSALRRFSAILVADLRERTRSTRFWVVLTIVGLATWWCFPSMDAGYLTLAFGENARGIYSSAWVGMTLGLLYSTMLSLIGFYLVRGTLVRDFDTRVWQLLVATPMTRGGYLLAKWVSHMAVFSLIVLVGIAVGGVAQWVRGEDRAFDFVELAKPVFVLALPALAVTAFYAIAFDLLPWLRRTGGNVLYFWVWIFLSVAIADYFDPEKFAWARHTWLSDPNGIALAMRGLAAQLHATAPWVKAHDIAIGAGTITGRPIVFAWNHWNLGWPDIMGRMLWVLLSMLAVIALAPMLDRAASRVRATDTVAAANPGRRLRWLDGLLLPLEALAAGRVLAAELKLVLRQRRLLWWLAMIGLGIAQLVGPRDTVGMAAIGAWLISVDVFARAILRERESGTGSLMFTAAGAARRLLFARIGVAVALAVLGVAPAMLHLAFVDVTTALSLMATALGVAFGGLAIGVLCRNPRPFELLMVTLAYIGAQGDGPLAAIAHPFDALRLQAVVLPTSAIVLAMLWPRLARAR